jgi:hypothetical protein
VSAETAQRVLIAVEQLKYRPNELARAFRGQRSHTIGLIIPYLYDPFFANCAHAVTAVAKEHGYSVIIATSNEDSNTEFEEVENMLRRHVDGLVAIPAQCHESRLTRALFGKTPVVIFDRPVPGLSLDVVTVQNTAGARRSCGCKNRTSVVIHSMIAEPASEAWKQRAPFGARSRVGDALVSLTVSSTRAVCSSASFSSSQQPRGRGCILRRARQILRLTGTSPAPAPLL